MVDSFRQKRPGSGCWRRPHRLPSCLVSAIGTGCAGLESTEGSARESHKRSRLSPAHPGVWHVTVVDFAIKKTRQKIRNAIFHELMPTKSIFTRLLLIRFISRFVKSLPFNNIFHPFFSAYRLLSQRCLLRGVLTWSFISCLPSVGQVRVSKPPRAKSSFSLFLF